ncbi:hypothetical protein BC940DRAFT_367572 [Gongronella butleri]|nr:hypothetical protein BC940DRAFT_367572 [Gongronella butleri]
MIKTISIIGAGSLGGTVAYALLTTLKDIKELLVVDMSPEILQGQVLDLQDAVSSATTTTVRAGTFKEAARSDLTILTANSPRQDEEARGKWVARSLQFMQGILGAMSPGMNDKMLFLVAIEPVDELVSLLRTSSGLGAKRIMGVGCTSMCQRRFTRWYREYQLANKVNASNDVTCWVIGSGAAPMVVWPSGIKDQKEQSDLDNVKKQWPGSKMFSSTLIREKKGDAWFGPSALIAETVQALAGVSTSTSTMVLCAYQPDLKLCTSVPCVIGPQGIQSFIDLKLTKDEQKTLGSMARRR